MTNLYPSLATAFKDLDKFYVGFDEQFDRLAKISSDLTKNVTTYPFYNIKKIGESKYQIELALAGWTRQEIEIELAEDKLIIKGNVQDDKSDTAEYFFKGISKRAFTRSFVLNDQVVVHGAEFINGILSILLERVIPENKKPRKIEIGEGKSESRQLLTED